MIMMVSSHVCGLQVGPTAEIFHEFITCVKLLSAAAAASR